MENDQEKMTGTQTASDLDPFEVFYDGQCPLCVKEIDMLRRKDKQNRIKFTDFTAEKFDDPELDLSYDDLMSQIHGRHKNGEVIRGVEVFRQLYSRIGFGGIVFVTRIPPISWLLYGGYRLFARFRLRLTGRHCDDGCAIPQTNQASESSRIPGDGGIN